MRYQQLKLSIYLLSVTTSLFPFVSVAQTTSALCSNNGYTIATINGVLTTDSGARENMVAVSKKVGFERNNQPIDYQYLLNPSHIGGLGDLVMSVYQKFFESETVSDYDLIEMLKDASAKVQTQKLLLVAHSQGNFYANSFYDVVAGQVGGLPVQSIGVYSVANPASRVAGNGKWLTSDTDNVIARLVAHLAPFHSIMPTNTHIAEVASSWDPLAGHDFTQVYLKYRAADIVRGIQDSLDKLSSDPARREDILCIEPPKITIAHQIAGVALGVTDTALATTAGAFAASYNTYANIVVWAYNTGTTLASTAYSAVAAALSSNSLAGNNGASVILATQPAQTPSSVSVNNNQTTVVAVPAVQSQPSLVATPSPAQAQPQAVLVFSPKVQNSASEPKLVFIGSFGGGGGAPTQAAPQILGTQTTAFVVDEATTTGEVTAGAVAALAAPALSAPQCAQTLATDGCLLATTTIHFEWAAVFGAEHYLINKNGEYATTTDTAFDVTTRDFSDYTFGVVAIGANGQASATSTQAVSLAMIPIAINEIAWMGTVASANDEWFEIKNNTAHTIDLSQWELNAKDGTPHVKLTSTIAPRAYLVFERTDNTTITDITAHQIYTGALGNAGEQLNLLHASTTFDQTPDGAWPAGENSTSTKKTMERYSSREPGVDPANWGTNLGYIKNGTDANGNAIDGTPGAQNSVSTLINRGQNITSDLTLTNAEEQYVIANALRVSASSTLTVSPGVAIKFYEENWWHPARLDVSGALSVQGTQENPVTFTSFTDIPAGSVEIHGTATSTITSAHFDTTHEGINTYSGATEITNSSFSNIKYEAVGVYGGASVSVASTTISNTTSGSAIGVYDESYLTVASSTIDGVLNRDGIHVDNSTLNISSSTIKNVSDSALGLYGATSTISNVTIENAGWNGIDISGGTATIASTTVSGVNGWAGISVDSPVQPVAITDGEVAGNTPFGVSTTEGSAILTDVSVHDNGTTPADNVVVW